MKFSIPILLASLFCLGTAHAENSRFGVPEGIQKRTQEFRSTLNNHKNQELNSTIDYFQELVEWALVLRAETLEFGTKIKAQRANGNPLTGAQLEKLRKGSNQHLALREEMLNLIEHYEYLSGEDPLLEKGVQLKSTMLRLSAALVLYDNFALTKITFANDSELRRLVNLPDSGFQIQSSQLDEILAQYHDPKNRSRVRAGLEFVRENRAWIRETKQRDPHLAYLHALIQQSPSSQEIYNDPSWKNYTRQLGLVSQASIDDFNSLGNRGSHLASMAFGNTIGLVQVRHGKLHDRPRVKRDMEKTLQPMDILLEKASFRLSDKIIPGHFGHVATWIGTEKDLEKLGLWDHPLVRPHQRKIRGGASILEALRDGVQLNDLDTFLNVDDVAVLRQRKLDREAQREHILRAFQQLGKQYDFNFDVETTDRIVCSELVYLIYTDVEWPTDNRVGRATISPDNVAIMARPNGPFGLARFYHDGKRVRKDPYQRYQDLVQAEARSSLYWTSKTRETLAP